MKLNLAINNKAVTENGRPDFFSTLLELLSITRAPAPKSDLNVIWRKN